MKKDTRKRIIPIQITCEFLIMMPLRKTLTTFAFLLLLCEPAWADKVYFFTPETAVQYFKNGLKKFGAKLTPAQIEERAKEFSQELATIHERLKPAPRFPSQFGQPNTFYHQGRILEYIEGQRGADMFDPANHDKILFVAHGDNGAHPSPQPVLISNRFLTIIQHEVDTLSDFSFRFSNRHELLSEPFGSPKHRDSLFKLFDPQGDAGLYSGNDVAINGQVIEGVLSKYLLNGPLTSDAMTSLSRYSLNDPRRAMMAMGNAGIPGRSSPDTTGQVGDYLRAIVQAKRYPGYDPKMIGYAANTVGILCGLAHGTPSLVSADLRNRATRSVNVGLGCYTSIIGSMMELVEGKSFNAFEEPDHLPVSPEAVVAEAIKIMIKEPFFKFYLGAEFLEDDQSVLSSSMGLYGGYTANSPEDSASRKFQYYLAKLAFDPPGKATLTDPAKALLIQLMVPDPKDAPQDQEDLETDRRYYRLRFYQALLDPHRSETNENWRSFARKHFCTHGWGHPADIQHLTDRAFYNSTRDPQGDVRRKTLIYENRVLLAAILQTEARAGAENSGVTPQIEEMIGFMKIDWEKGFSGPSEADFLKIFPLIMEQNACAL